MTRTCPVCGREYKAKAHRLKWGRQTTCSRACSYKLRHDAQRKPIERPCAICGCLITRPPHQFTSRFGLAFCSPDCQAKGQFLPVYRPNGKRRFTVSEYARTAWLVRNRKAGATRKANGWKPSAATRAKLSSATSKAIAAGKYKVVSGLEDRVAEHVARWDLRYVRQFPFMDVDGRGYIADFWFPSLRAVLEVNGTFWHADPRVYPEPRHRMQHSRVAKDVMKRAYCDRQGIRYVVVWEMDFKADPDAAMQRALNQVNGEPEVTYAAAS